MKLTAERCIECGTDLILDRIRRVMYCPFCEPVEEPTVTEVPTVREAPTLTEHVQARFELETGM